MQGEKIKIKYKCGMKYSVILGPNGPKFKEHDACNDSGSFLVDQERWDKNLNIPNHNLIFVRCKKCGQELNLQSGNMEIV